MISTNFGLGEFGLAVRLADDASGGRAVALVLLIKSGNQPLSGDLLIPNWFLSVECVAGLHVPLIRGIHFGPCRSEVKSRPMV